MDDLTLDTLLRLLPDADDLKRVALLCEEAGAREDAMRLRDAARVMKRHEQAQWAVV